MLPGLEAKAIDYIERYAEAAKSGKPFFLYVALSSPHSPVVPSEAWQNKSGLNAHADFVMQTDHTVGKIIQAIDDAGLRENTLVVFTSDNGTSGPTSDMAELMQMGHYSSWILRGSKADIWDGGHRVPFIARWPAKTDAGSRCPELLCFTDFMPTVADIVGCKLPDDAAADGFSYKRILHGKKQRKKREAVIHHSIRGKFAVRNGEWKLVLCPGSGGWTDPKDPEATEIGLPDIQLYNMETDIREQENVYAEHPEVVRELLQMLNTIVEEGRSTRGAKLQNDTEDIDIWKGITPIAYTE
jgi:arylsulfatase A-like enzyme